MQNRSGTIQKTVFVFVVILLFLLGVWFYFDSGIFISKRQVVLSTFNADQMASKVNSQCKGNNSTRCFDNFFANFAKSNKFETTKSVLEKLIKINKSVSYCHSIAHEISIAEVAKNPQNWLNVFSYVPDRECSYGFFHGVIEGKYQTDPNLVVNARLVDKVCLKLTDKRSERSCAHAFGHIILVRMEGRVQEAINECRLVDSGVKNSCFEGVFMEHIEKDNLSEHGIEVRANWNKKYVDGEKKSCESYPENEQIECWRSLGPAILNSSRSDYIAAVNQCNQANLDLSKKACIRKVLGQLVVNAFSNGIVPRVDYCGLFNTKAEYEACLNDIISYVLLTSTGFKDQMEQYCLRVAPEAGNTCLQTLKRYI